MKFSNKLLVGGLGTIVATTSLLGFTSATSDLVKWTMICPTILRDNTSRIQSIKVVPYYDGKMLSSDLWKAEKLSPNLKGTCASVPRDWLLGAAQPGTSFNTIGTDKDGKSYVLEMRDIAMFRHKRMISTQLVDLRYHINYVAGSKVTTLVGTAPSEFIMDDNGKLSELTQKGIYSSDMKDLYALDTMRQIGATKYTKIIDFKGKDNVTREQAAKFFVMTWQATHSGAKIPTNSSGCGFGDINKIDPTLLESVKNACQLGLMKGSAGNFNPQNNITLAEAVTVLMRMQYGSVDEKNNNIWYQGYFNQAYGVELFDHFAYNPHINEGVDLISREMIAFLIRRLLEINNIQPKFYNTI